MIVSHDPDPNRIVLQIVEEMIGEPVKIAADELNTAMELNRHDDLNRIPIDRR